MVEIDREQKKKWHKIGVIFAEFVMVASVIAIVVITTLIAMGWNVNREGDIEQTGLLQLHTIPTGATVEIDGETMFARTNMSRSLSPGSHHLKTTRDGYDVWEKDIEMASGWLMRIYYPRIFLQERETEKMMDLGTDLEFYSAASNRKYLLWAEADSTVWKWADVSGDKVKVTEINVAEVLGATDGVFTGEVVNLIWSRSGEKVLLTVRQDGVQSWYLLNLREVSKSQNLSADFGLSFTTIEIMDDAADKLWTLENGNLRLVNAASRESSRILVDGVESFHSVEGVVAYVRKTAEGAYWAGSYHEGEQGAVDLYRLEQGLTHVWLSRYYNEDYLILASGQKIIVYRGDLPSYNTDEKVKASDHLAIFAERILGFEIEWLTGSENNEYILAWNGGRVVALDLDQGETYEYEAGSSARWLDDSMLYGTTDGPLMVWDFDGTNRRKLVDEVSDKDVMITENDRYLYYVKTVDGVMQLMREQIVG